MMNSEVQDTVVRKEVLIEAAPEHVFRVFTASMDKWWPRTHHIGKSENFEAILENKVGGRWYERRADGSECDWGHVLVWDDPSRLVLSWEVTKDGAHSSSLQTEVEVQFTEAGSGCTRVLLEHRKLDNYGEDTKAMREVYDSEGAWVPILHRLKGGVEQTGND